MAEEMDIEKKEELDLVDGRMDGLNLQNLPQRVYPSTLYLPETQIASLSSHPDQSSP